MNFSDEEYVRLYVTDTVTWKCLQWEGQALLALALRKFDRAGVLEFGRHGPEKALLVATELPLEVIQAGLPRLLTEEVWVLEDSRILWPKYVDAQTCKRSDRVRQRMSRAIRRPSTHDADRDDVSQESPNRDTASRSVTDGHVSEQIVTNVTKCHPRRGEARQGIDPSLLDPSGLGGSDAREIEPEPTPKPPRQISAGAKRFAASFATPAPDQIEFTPEHREFEQNGIDLQETWLHCRDYRRSKSYNSENWQAEFLAWLRKEAGFRRERGDRAKQHAPPQPNDPTNRYVPPRVIS